MADLNLSQVSHPRLRPHPRGPTGATLNSKENPMVRLQPWQWAVLGLPIAAVISFLLIAAGLQIHEWHLNWIWAIFGVIFVGWRWLLVKWTQPARAEVAAVVAELTAELTQSESQPSTPPNSTDVAQQAAAAVQTILQATRSDPPPWEDWNLFWQRCLSLIRAIAQVYSPQAKQPLLNIYVPQAYALLRGTVDDSDQWMQKLAPVLNQVTIGQAYEAYGFYQKIQPSARKIWRVWSWAQWILNPIGAVTRTVTQRTNDRATQELLGNLSQLLRETVLRNLGQQAIALYSNRPASTVRLPQPALPSTPTQTLREIISQAQPVAAVAQQPVNVLLAGRTGAGKSSLINTLFVAANATVDTLPSTDRCQAYQWQTPTGETLTLWDTPGYEQVDRPDQREQVLIQALQADLVLLVTPALDPALQMDREFLQDLQTERNDLPTIVLVTQVDRLRPFREWQPPYDWQTGDRPKEIAIREAIAYRQSSLETAGVLPLVTGGPERLAWGVEALSQAILEAVPPAQQLRLARFLRDQDSRILAAAQIIDQYMFQMTTQQGLAAFLKSPILSFIATLTTGTPALAIVLAEKIPVEQLPLVIGKLQMAYDLFNLLTVGQIPAVNFELGIIWPLLINHTNTPNRNAWACGHALTEYWTRSLSAAELQTRFEAYLQADA
jgi:uncharacterized protein